MSVEEKGLNELKFRVIYLKDGLAAGSFFECVGAEESAEAVEPETRAQEYQSEVDTQGLVILDFSAEDQKEQALEKISAVCQKAMIPVYAAGNIDEISDIGHLLEAGCDLVILNMVKDSNQEMLEEASETFGKEHIGVYLPDYNTYLMQNEKYEEFSGLLLLDEGRGGEEIAEETKLPVLIHNEGEGSCKKINFDRAMVESTITWADFKTDGNGLVPCIVQDHENGEVLMLAYMNEESFNKTLESGRMTYWSRSRQELWMKGLTSGHFQYVKTLSIDCDNDTLLAKVAQVGAACHTGHRTCFYRDLVNRK